MVKWLVAGGLVLAAVVYLLVQLGGPPAERARGATGAPTPERAGPTAVAPPVAATPRGQSIEAAAAADQLAPSGGPALSGATLDNRLDSDYPRRFAASVANRCDVSGLDPDAKATVEYRLTVVRGEVLATGVRITKSSLGDPALEQCIAAAVEQTRWRDEEVADLAEDHEFLFRVRAQKKHLPPEAQETFGKAPDAPPEDDPPAAPID